MCVTFCQMDALRGSRWGQKSRSQRLGYFLPPPRTEWCIRLFTDSLFAVSSLCFRKSHYLSNSGISFRSFADSYVGANCENKVLTGWVLIREGCIHLKSLNRRGMYGTLDPHGPKKLDIAPKCGVMHTFCQPLEHNLKSISPVQWIIN